MSVNPKATVLVIDPQNSSRWIEIRGHIHSFTQEGAEQHADMLTQRYRPGKVYFYRDIYPPEQREKETRVIFKLEPVKVNLDAIFK